MEDNPLPSLKLIKRVGPIDIKETIKKLDGEAEG
jgi:hypothetical protein